MKRTKHAAIAQPVERILGKDEVASSNLASSSTFNTRNRKVSGVILCFANFFQKPKISDFPETDTETVTGKIFPGRISPTRTLFSLILGLGLLERIPKNLACTPNTFLVGMGVHPQGNRFVGMSKLL